MFRLRSKIRKSKAKGAQYTTVKMTWDVARGKPMNAAGDKIV